MSTDAAGRAAEPPARPVAQRALGQVRLLAVALLVVAAVAYRPSSGAGDDAALPAGPAAVAGALLLAVVVAGTAVLRRRWPHRPTWSAALGTGADLLVVLAVVCAAGLPPRSLAVALLMLPLLEAALWCGLAGLGATWLTAAVVLAGYASARSGPRLVDDLTGLMVALPVVLMVTVPVAVLAEHLVAEVARLQRARRVADDRVALLEQLSSVTAELFPLDVPAVATALTTGAQRLGAAAAAVFCASDRNRETPLATAGVPADLAMLRAARAGARLDVAGDRSLLAWALPAAYGDGDGDGSVLCVLLDGHGDQVRQRVDAVDLLVAQGRAALANAALVQELARLKHTYQQQADHDQLTGLVNRRGLLAQARALSGRLAVLFCDLDGFKAVNDTLGHAAGDELLREVAARLSTAAGGRGVLGRLGGDEFVLVLPAQDAGAIAELAAALERAVALPYALTGGPAHVGVSIGTALAAPGQHDLEDCLDRADQTMYAVKQRRRALPRQPGPGLARSPATDVAAPGST